MIAMWFDDAATKGTWPKVYGLAYDSTVGPDKVLARRNVRG
jgi:hypothetical protein